MFLLDATEPKLPGGPVPASPEEIATERARASKQDVTYANSGQTPPNTGGSKPVVAAAVQVWIAIIAGYLLAAWLWHISKREDRKGGEE
jgi:hypothetical protein